MAVKNSIKVGPLVFFLKMFVITENIMKYPVQAAISKTVTIHTDIQLHTRQLRVSVRFAYVMSVNNTQRQTQSFKC